MKKPILFKFCFCDQGVYNENMWDYIWGLTHEIDFI